MSGTSAVPDDAAMTDAPALGENASEPGQILVQQQQHDQNNSNGNSGNDSQYGQHKGHEQPQPQFSEHQNQNQQQTDADAPTSAPDAAAAAVSVPPAFPKKRRGRPPGRPNATVRDADYGGNPLVQAWNAAKNDPVVTVVSINIRDALTEQSLIHETQRVIFRLPSRETLLYVQGWITAKHIASQRPSYVNGLLIHSRGQDAQVSCTQCTEKRAKNALGPFLTCRVLPGSYHNSCSNCKWFDNTSNCSLYTGPKPNRKRKAKDELPPPPAPDSSGAPITGNANPDAAAASLPTNGPDDESLIHPQLRLQPEADMTLVPEAEHQQVPGMSTQPAPSDNGPPARLRSRAAASNSDIAEVPSQPDSLSESHFGLRKSGSEEGAGAAEDDETDYVDAQLAAQLLPEIQRQDC